MEYCKSHLSAVKRGRRAGTAVLLTAGGLFTAFWLFLTAALTTAEDAAPPIFLLAAVIFLLPGGVMLFFGVRRLRRSRAASKPEESRLARSIRRQLPAEQAGRTADELFALVDRDLQGGQTFGSAVVVGREWALVGDFAVRIAGIRGIFLMLRTSRTAHTYVSSHQIKVYDDAREAGEAVFLMDGDTALACLKALQAAAPWAVRGGMAEEMELLAMPLEEFRRWSERLDQQRSI